MGILAAIALFLTGKYMCSYLFDCDSEGEQKRRYKEPPKAEDEVKPKNEDYEGYEEGF